MRVSYVNDSNHLRQRATEMRASSKELKDSNTAAVILRLAALYDRLAIAQRSEAIAQCRRTKQNQKKATRQPSFRLRNAL